MKVLELLDEIEDTVEEIMGTSLRTSLGIKIEVETKKIIEIAETVREIRMQLPDEIQQAKWVMDERQRILDEARRKSGN